jgi:hypothetical protein
VIDDSREARAAPEVAGAADCKVAATVGGLFAEQYAQVFDEADDDDDGRTCQSQKEEGDEQMHDGVQKSDHRRIVSR